MDLLYKTVSVSSQTGFRLNYSFHTALLRILDDWITDIDRNKIVGCLLLDFSSKAFDLVNQSVLLHNIDLFGFHPSAINWVSSYLIQTKSGVSSDND